jgi:hypothetical protein
MRDLKERLESLATEGEPLGPNEVMRRARSSLHGDEWRRVRGRRALISAVAAGAVVAVVIGTIAVLQRSGDDGPSIAAGGAGDKSSASTPDADGTLFLVPTVVPEGFELVRAAGGDAVAKVLRAPDLHRLAG